MSWLRDTLREWLLDDADEALDLTDVIKAQANYTRETTRALGNLRRSVESEVEERQKQAKRMQARILALERQVVELREHGAANTPARAIKLREEHLDEP